MKTLCDTCSRNILSRCFKPTGNDDGTSTMEKCKDVYVNDTTCDYYDKIPSSKIVMDFILRPFRKIKYKLDVIFDFIKYKVILYIKHGFDIRDVWNLYDNIAGYTKVRLRYFIDHKPFGVPSVLTRKEFIIDNNLSTYFTGDLNDDWFDHSGDIEEVSEAWTSILEAIYLAMDIITDEDNKYDHFGEDEFGDITINKDTYKKYTDMKTEGLRLFGLFFENLWD